MSAGETVWPGGFRAALSISFDDGRPSQVERGVPVLSRHGYHGTFYVLPSTIAALPDAWRRAAAAGHELGNHTTTHPCSGNFAWSRDNALEELTLEQIRAELDTADAAIRELTGSAPVSFAYPCGQRFVGRGADCRSYVPLIAERYLVGRGYPDEGSNDPLRCDLAQAMGVGVDGLELEQIRPLVEEARDRGAWLILAAHDVGDVSLSPHDLGEQVLDGLCAWLRELGDVWVAPVGAVGAHVRRLQNDEREDSR